MATGWKSAGKRLEREIEAVKRLISREGKTAVLQNRLDEVERRIGEFSKVNGCEAYAKRLCDAYTKQLKDALDEVK